MLPSEPPPAVAALLEGVELEAADDHWSDAWVVRAGPWFVKASPPTALSPAAPEHDRLRWAATTGLRVPAVVAYEESDAGWQWLVTEAVPGRPLRPHRDASLTPDTAVDLLAAAVRAVHDIPVASCPFAIPDRFFLDHARAVHATGKWEDDGYLQRVAGDGLNVDQAFAEAECFVPSAADDAVVCHGDPSGFNLIVDDAGDWTWIDWGWAGVGHRAHDLATASIAVRLDLGDHWVEPFFEAYGRRPDPVALRHFTVVDGLS